MDIEKELKAIGFENVSHISFKKATSFPYVTWFGDNEYSGSDTKIFIKDTDYVIELYTNHDSEIEADKIRNMLISKGIEFKENESYIKDEKSFLNAFYLSVKKII